jgi:hypothetical protein
MTGLTSPRRGTEPRATGPQPRIAGVISVARCDDGTRPVS